MKRDRWEPERLRQYATELQELIDDADAAIPDQIEATDSTDAVRMTIGRDALPETIRVVGDWRRKLDPGAVGAAVLEAYAACMRRRSAEWSRILENRGFADWTRHLDEWEADASPPATPLPDVSHIEPRPTELIAEDILNAADAALAATARPPAPAAGATGSTQRGEVALTLSAGGLVSCEVDPEWAARQTAVRLTEALRTALSRAREDLAAARPGRASDVGARLSELLSELFASSLNDPRSKRSAQ